MRVLRAVIAVLAGIMAVLAARAQNPNQVPGLIIIPLKKYDPKVPQGSFSTASTSATGQQRQSFFQNLLAKFKFLKFFNSQSRNQVVPQQTQGQGLYPTQSYFPN